jgi:hypothetical protein
VAEYLQALWQERLAYPVGVCFNQFKEGDGADVVLLDAEGDPVALKHQAVHRRRDIAKHATLGAVGACGNHLAVLQ